eukprot:gnl/TRDRNA2_/TRDRNA2_38422_c0_seq1.p1 gnl/TRDRNA2_/TRDRNA2_38422_c0~~gnl/TRDRNA2_/TRDRNA2_38422_c0_seq1.p1  ORF type:complete len:680 (+),score=121.65 gnl/TRDRNA2_/TRDRNA2_38422_c0_seq1:171-2042(+)
MWAEDAQDDEPENNAAVATELLASILAPNSAMPRLAGPLHRLSSWASGGGAARSSPDLLPPSVQSSSSSSSSCFGGCFQALRHGKRPGLEDQTRGAVPQTPSRPAPPPPVPRGVLLDVGFVHMGLTVPPDSQRCELYLQAQKSATTDEGIGAVLQFMEHVLMLPQVCEIGFWLIYDLRPLHGRPQLELLTRLLSWVYEPARKDIWKTECHGWKIVVADRIQKKVAKMFMTSMFFFTPPIVRTYLVSDPEEEVGDHTTHYEPQGIAFVEGLSSTESSAAWSSMQQFLLLDEISAVMRGSLDVAAGVISIAVNPKEPLPPQPPASGSPHVQAVTADDEEPNAEASDSASKRNPLLPPPPSLDVGFAICKQGVGPKCKASPSGAYVEIIGKDGQLSEESTMQMLDFVDAFTSTDYAATGFSVTFDLRGLRTPSMSMVTRLAEWGSEPERKAFWEKHNVSSKIVINPGVRFHLCKGVLSTFFFVCPPVCRTYLLSDPDESEETACIFDVGEPVSKDGEADEDGTPTADAETAGTSAASSGALPSPANGDATGAAHEAQASPAEQRGTNKNPGMDGALRPLVNGSPFPRIEGVDAHSWMLAFSAMESWTDYTRVVCSPQRPEKYYTEW